MKWEKAIGLGLSLLIVLASCKKNRMDAPGTNPTGPNTPPTVPTGPYIYIGGSVNSKAAYWKIASNVQDITPIPVANASRITSVVVSDTNVYMAGPSNASGVYWKNGVPVSVANASEIDYLALSGTDVYGAGFDNSGNIAYWDGNNEVNLENTLPAGIGYSMGLTGIAVSGNDAYVTGSLLFIQMPGDTSYYGNSAVYWKNSNIYYLNNHGFGGVYYPSTSGLALSGKDVYVAGNIDIDADTMAWCGYWKDSVKISLANRSGDNYASANAVAVSGNDVYVVGTMLSTGFSAVYWKNGNMVTLPSGAAAVAIAISGSDVYILGSDNEGNTVVWKNGVIAVTLGQVTATCLAIGN